MFELLIAWAVIGPLLGALAGVSIAASMAGEPIEADSTPPRTCESEGGCGDIFCSTSSNEGSNHLPNLPRNRPTAQGGKR